MPRTSIVIPVHNGALHLRHAVESALAQEDTDREIVISDNASSDRTRETVDDLLGHRGVRYQRFDEELGMAASFNRALASADGDYVRFLCHDDWLSPDCVGTSVRALLEHPSAIVVTSYEETFGERVIRRGPDLVASPGLMSGGTARKEIVRRGNWVGGPSAVTLRRAGLPQPLFRDDFRCSFDVEAWLRLLCQGDIFVSPQVLFGSRIHAAQATNECSTGGFRDEWTRILAGLNHRADGPRVPRRLVAYSRLRNALGR